MRPALPPLPGTPGETTVDPDRFTTAPDRMPKRTMDMNQTADTPAADPPETGDRFGGYRVLRTAELPEIQSRSIELEHEATGARHLHIHRKDHENVFAVAFKTVPADDTGVAHILEHTALCGSRRYPVRDPFFSMIRRSLNTFMNAFTASDWTMYPFATRNRKDFDNLLDIYLDAAFFPRLDRLSFLQEGHRLEMEDGKPVFKGVVFNEMKGAMSSPNQILGRSLLAALFPDTTYRHNSGGEPAAIPDLTHEQLRAFHARHYHPSNSWFFTYGDFPLADHLARIEAQVLSRFGRIDPETGVPSQPRWTASRDWTVRYPLDPGESPERKFQGGMAWLLNDVTDIFQTLAAGLLGDILIGNPGAPLRKALIDSGMGAALADGAGIDADCRDVMFVCGLKDMAGADIPRLNRLIMDTLGGLADGGIDRELVEAAIHKLEFRRKEVTNTPYPYGLKLLMTACGPWFHGADPADILRIDRKLIDLREALDTGPFFENRIRRFLLDNPHHVRFSLIPDPDKARRDNEAETARLAEAGASLTSDDRRRIEEESLALAALQESGEDLSCLPTLELRDIPPLTDTVPPSAPYGALDAKWYEQPTSGILYLIAAAGAGGFTDEQQIWLPFFCSSFTRLGTRKRDYTSLARLIDRYTGGAGLSANVRMRYEGKDECVPFAVFNIKALNRNADPMFDLMNELLTETDFSDLDRMGTLLAEYRAAMESAVVSRGHGFAMSRAARVFGTNRRLNETWSGIRQLRHIKEFTDGLNSGGAAAGDRLAGLAELLAGMGRTLFHQSNLRPALIGEDAALLDAVSPLTSIIRSLPGGDRDGFHPPAPADIESLPREGWSTATTVSFMGRAFPTVRMDHEDAPALAVTAKLLRAHYLHREIREKGGAYSGFSLYSQEDGLFCMGSYRDPRISETIDIFDKAGDFLAKSRFSDEEIKESILQVCADIDHPDTPAAAARKSFFRNLTGLTDALRQNFKKGLLAVSKADVKRVAERYFSAALPFGDAVISSRELLDAANAAGLKDRRLDIHSL